jgi:hypothetical protein
MHRVDASFMIGDLVSYLLDEVSSSDGFYNRVVASSALTNRTHWRSKATASGTPLHDNGTLMKWHFGVSSQNETIP